MCCVCLLVGFPQISVHMISIGGWLHLELLGSYTCDKELFCRCLGTGDKKVDLPLGPNKQIGIHAVEGRGSPHIYTNLEISH